MWRSTVGVLLMAVMPIGAYAAPGDLDTTFGTGGTGYVTTTIGELSGATNMVRLPDGKLLVAGTSLTGNVRYVVLARYNANGTLDNTFDKDGKVITTVPGVEFVQDVKGLLVQDDGKLVVTGNVTIPGSGLGGNKYKVLVARYNTNGTLDTGFSGDGLFVSAFTSGHEMALTTIQLDNSQLMTAATIGSVFSLVRFNTDGSLDTAFDTDGLKATTLTGSVGDMIKDADGKLVVAGQNSGGAQMMLARMDTDGVLDTTFDTDGMVTADTSLNNEMANKVIQQADGKLVAAGFGQTCCNDDFALVRFNTNGSPDNTFNTDGIFTSSSNFDAAFTGDQLVNLVEQADGQLVALGRITTVGGAGHIVLWRVTSTGLSDVGGFGTIQGMSEFYTNDANSAAVIVHQPDGKLVIAGNDGTNFLLARFESGQPNADGDGYINLLDNCASDVNNDQLDTDADGYGDVCDTDDDGDGYDDMYDAYPLDAGALTGMDGERASDNFGRSVSYAGDFNSDGYGDYIVGAPLADVLVGDTLLKDAGAAYVISGQTGEILQMYHGDTGKDYFGFAVAGVGDINSDGAPDVAVGAYLDDDGVLTDVGSVQVFSANSIYPQFAWWGTSSKEYFGFAVAGAGDVDNDGNDDVVVGSPLANGGAGRISVHRNEVGTPFRSIDGTTAGAQFGYAVAGIGDINNDGYADIIAGAPLDDRDNGDGSFTADTGSARIISPFDSVIIGVPFYGTTAKSSFGASVSAAGDVDNDGTDDVAVGAWKDDPVVVDVVKKDAGAVYVYSGTGTAELLVIKGQVGKDGLGYAIAPAGDIDNDGNADIAVGTYGYDAPATKVMKDAGKMVVYSGADGSTELLSAKGHAAGDWFGAALAVGDTNKDGIDDIIVGVPKDDVLPDGSTKALKDAGSAVVISGALP